MAPAPQGVVHGFGLVPAPEHPAGPNGQTYRPAAELTYTATTGGRRQRLRAFVELHHPATGTEHTAEQLAACARLWERRWKAFPSVLVVLTGAAAADVGTTVEGLCLAAEEQPAVAELLAAVPAGAACLEDLVQHGPAAPVWHPLGDNGRRPHGWTRLQP
ncbi:hypothetical protein [Kitasatospora sp. NPDC098663]|uniref:hypothetical protein n=1 Tax=Kitasatospora sp. NPDC098663 TaxID=3364096 RepID=UPI003817B298